MQLHMYHLYSESNAVTHVSSVQREQCSYTCIICIARGMQLHMYNLYRENNAVTRFICIWRGMQLYVYHLYREVNAVTRESYVHGTIQVYTCISYAVTHMLPARGSH